MHEMTHLTQSGTPCRIVARRGKREEISLIALEGREDWQATSYPTRRLRPIALGMPRVPQK